MIMILMALFAILAFVAWLILPDRKWSLVLGILASLGLIATVGAMTLNFTHQLGMREVQTVETKKIYSAGNPWESQGMIIAEPLGTAKNNFVMVYRDDIAETKPTVHFKPDQSNLTEAAKRHATYKQDGAYKQAEVETKTTRLEWQNSLMKWLFGTSGQDRQVVREDAVVHVPANWTVVSKADAEKMMGDKK